MTDKFYWQDSTNSLMVDLGAKTLKRFKITPKSVMEATFDISGLLNYIAEKCEEKEGIDMLATNGAYSVETQFVTTEDGDTIAHFRITRGDVAEEELEDMLAEGLSNEDIMEALASAMGYYDEYYDEDDYDYYEDDENGESDVRLDYFCMETKEFKQLVLILD